MLRRPDEKHEGLAWRERLLDASLRSLCSVMRAAARCAGVAVDAPHVRAAVDFQALTLSGWMPLGEIAAAQREIRN